jgi:multiphosphoryl transfer protein
VVGIVIVSHSHRIAEGVAELAREMGGPDVRLEPAGGLDMPDHPTGTDAMLVMGAIDRAWSDGGVLVLMDLGSAVLSAEMALDMLPEERRDRVLLCEAPIVEGAVAAAVAAKVGGALESVAAEARGGLAGKIAHLKTPAQGSASVEGSASEEGSASAVDPASARSVRLTIRNPHGLHARPAARLVQTAAAFDATVHVRNVTTGRGPADAASLNGVATLGAATGHEVEVTASGPRAAEAVDAIQALAERDFDEGPEAAAPPPPAQREARKASPIDGVLRGFAASPGFAIGPARRFHVAELAVPESEPENGRAEATDTGAEAAALDRAIAAARVDIERQRETVSARAGAQEAGIFDAHLLFLRDAALLEPSRHAIAEGRAAAHAWHDAVERTAAEWDGLEDDYLRARAADLRSVGAQVLARLLGVEPPGPRLETPGILLADDLTPADAAALDPVLALGIVTAHGGPTSHGAVLARSLGIPAVVGVGQDLLAVEEGTPLGLDAETGELHVRPASELRERLGADRREREETMRAAREAARNPAATRDGVVIEVAANVGAPGEVAGAVEAGADGVGLFRTEFLFMERPETPDEDEQEAAYRMAAEALGGRWLLLRTLDAGADKSLPALGLPPEPNPFLGVRGIRLGLERTDLLETQLRAVLRVAADHPVRVMFPMVATLDELRGARAALDRARKTLRSDAKLETGVMIEVPSAALTADALAAEADFFSIGTNDLTQYALAADRGNERVASLADALHPAVLRLIGAAVEGANAHGRWVGVCGEVAGDPAVTSLLLGLGAREFSMSAPAIASVKQEVRATDLAGARALAHRALACATAAEVRALLPDA